MSRHWILAVRAASVAVSMLATTPMALAQLAEFSDVPTIADFVSILAPAGAETVGIANRSDIELREIRDEPVLPASLLPPGNGSPHTTDVRIRPPTHRPHATPTAITMPDVFALNSAELPAKTIAMLDNLAAAMKKVPEAVVLITGHTDSTGPATFNLALSESRAQAALRHLTVVRGVDGGRIQVLGVGSRQPIVGLDPAAPNNRRIQVWGQPGPG